MKRLLKTICSWLVEPMAWLMEPVAGTPFTHPIDKDFVVETMTIPLGPVSRCFQCNEPVSQHLGGEWRCPGCCVVNSQADYIVQHQLLGVLEAHNSEREARRDLLKQTAKLHEIIDRIETELPDKFPDATGDRIRSLIREARET